MDRGIQITALSPARVRSDEGCLARFHFVGDRAAPESSGCDRALALPLAGGSAICEEWTLDGAVEHSSMDGLMISRGKDYAVLSWSGPLQRDIRTQTRTIYATLMSRCRELGYDYFLRFWNHIPDISLGDGDAERYRQFCLGRGEVFTSVCATMTPPAGTAVGVPPGAPLQVILLAQTKDFRAIENPRQMSAYRYPRIYGPRSPTFSRATMSTASQLFVSGTAAIVGHTSRHEGSFEKQFQETVRNWKSLIAHAAETCELFQVDIAQGCSFRVYLKDSVNYDIAARALLDIGLDPDKVAVLRADICRRELLFEMDGVLNFPATSEG